MLSCDVAVDVLHVHVHVLCVSREHSKPRAAELLLDAIEKHLEHLKDEPMGDSYYIESVQTCDAVMHTSWHGVAWRHIHMWRCHVVVMC